MAIASINGLDIFYTARGSGEKVVMTHGSWTNADSWQAITPLLSERYEVIAWDRRGHSRSQDGSGSGTLEEDALDLVSLIEYLGGGPVHLVGNSSGGAIVLSLLAKRPDLVRGAVVHEPGAFALLDGIDDGLLERERSREESVKRLIEAGEHREAARYFIDELAIGPGAWDAFPPRFRDTLVANAHTVLEDMDEAYRDGWIDIAGLVRGRRPLLITVGHQSPEILVASTRELARRVPSELREMADVGHVPHRTHAEEYAGVLIDFFERSPALL